MRNREHVSLFKFSAFCLVRCVGLTDADMEALAPPCECGAELYLCQDAPDGYTTPLTSGVPSYKGRKKPLEKTQPGRGGKKRDRFCLIWS